MKRHFHIAILLALLLALAGCQSPKREARRMVARAEALADTLSDSTARLIDSVLRMPVYFSERQRMDMALLQGEALFRDAPLDDDLFEDTAYRVATSPELERAADYYAKKKQYDKAAHAALYSGYVQQHYHENEAAMRSYKDAEQYGLLSNDSLTMARAEYRMGKLLYYEGRKQEALCLFKESSKGFRNRHLEYAKVLNSMACCYLLSGQNDSTEICLNQGLAYADIDNTKAMRHKILNNSAVLYRLQGKYEQALYCLRQMMGEPDLNGNELFMLSLNMGNVYSDKKKMDSAAVYYRHVEDLLMSKESVEPNTLLSAYDALYRFAEYQNNDSLTLYYHEKHEKLLFEIMRQRQQQTLYRIQQQYDYESLQNAMNRKIIRRQRVISSLSALAAFVIIALAFSQIRLAIIKKQEAEIKASLFRFMEQNEKLSEQNEAFKKAHYDLEQRHIEHEEAYQELTRQFEENKTKWENYDKKLRKALLKEQNVMQKMAVYIHSNKSKASFEALQYSIYGNLEYWDAMLKLFDDQFPGLRKRLAQKLTNLTETEQRILVLTYLDTSREDTATLLNISIFMVDKLRNSVRKKMLELGM